MKKKYIGLIHDERNDNYTIGYRESEDLKKMIDWRKDMLVCGNVIDCKIYELKEIDMSKERYNQIMDEVYEKVIREYGVDWITLFETKEIFIDKCKADQEFSKTWELKIEERELTEERRYNIWFNNNYETGMERFFNPEELPDYDNPYYEPTPKKEIIVTYQEEKIKFYE